MRSCSQPLPAARDLFASRRSVAEQPNLRKPLFTFDAHHQVVVGGWRVLVLPRPYHGHLKGILDDKHATLSLCVPIHQCEFTGQEPPAAYRYWQPRVGVERWSRNPFPYVAMAFENPKGHYGSPMERTPLDSCIANLAALEGVTKGFAELTNYEGQVISIRPIRGHKFRITESAREFDCKSDDVAALVTAFVTARTAA